MKHVAFIFVLLMNCGAFASEALTVKGFRPGMAYEEFRAKLPTIECDDLDGIKHCSYFPKLERESEVRTRAFLPPYIADLQLLAGLNTDAWTFVFVNGVLGEVTVYLNQRNFDDMLAPLVSKFGKPAQMSQDTLQNRMGARFRSRLYVWVTKDAVLRAQEHGSELDTSIVALQGKSFEADRKRRARAAAKEAAKDF